MKNNTTKTRNPSAWVLGGLTSLVMCLSALGQYSSTSTSPNSPITINPGTPQGATAAVPYPSVIDLTGANLVGTIEGIAVSVTLTHTYTPDVGLLLVGPNGQGVVLMNHVGTGPVSGLTVSFAATGSSIVRGQALAATTYAPTDLSGENFVNAGGAGGPPLTPNCVSLTALAQALTGATASGKWQLYVQDDTVLSSGSISSWTLNLYTTPLFATVSTNSVTLAENGPATALGFSVLDSSPPPSGGFTVTASGAATSLVNVPSTKSGLTGTITLTPVANVFGGPSTLTVTVSDGVATTSTNVNVTVTHVEQTPTIALSTNSVTLSQGQISLPLTNFLTDVDNSNLTVTVSSDNPNVVSANGVFFNPVAGTIYTRPFAIVPEGNAIGTAHLTFSVSDGTLGSSAPSTMTVTVNPVPQQVAANTNVITLSASSPTNPVITVTGVAGVIGKMTVAVNGLQNVDPTTLGLALKSKNTGATLTLLTPPGPAGPRNYAQLVFDDNGSAALTPTDTATNALVIHPSGGNLASFIGDSPNDTWTLVVTDGYESATSEIVGGWLINLYIAPIITPITPSTPALTLAEGGTSTITFSITDPQNAAIYSTNATAGNPAAMTVGAAISVSSLAYTNGKGSFVLTANYANNSPYQYGTNFVTLTATDANGLVGTTIYAVTVAFQNHQPSVGFIEKQVTYNAEPITTPPFTVSDVDYPNQPLTVLVSSDNPHLLPNSNIILNQVAYNASLNTYTYTLTLYPVGSAASTADVSVTVNDGQGLANSTAVSTFVFAAEGPPNPLLANLTPINIPTASAASIYPSTVNVSGLIGTVSTVSVTLFDLSYNQYLSGLNVLLVSPEGGTHAAMLLGNLGDGTTGFTNATLIFTNGQPNLPATGPLATGSFSPTEGVEPATAFFPPYPSAANNLIPPPPYGTSLATAFQGLSGTNLNGTWSLYIYNTNQLGKGVLLNGWQLSITTTPNVQAPNNVTIAENASTVNIPLTVGDVQVGGNIGVMATPVPAGIVTVAPAMDASGNWSLNITPQPFQYYSNIAVTITATNLQGATSSAGFDVTVFQVPLSPVLVETAIPNITMGRATYGSTTFHVWDPQGLTLNPSALSTDAKDLGIVSTTLGTPVSQTLFGHTVSVYPVTVTVLPNGAFFGGPIPVDVTVSDTSTAKPLNTAFNVTVIEGTPLFVNQDSSPANPILLPIGYPLASNAFPFPSAISVDNLVGYVTGVEVTLVGFQHQFPSEVDVLLVGPDNKTAVVLMAHAGDGLPTPAGGLRLTFDQASPNTLVPGAALATGTYQPANLAGALSFAGPAPAPTLSGFYSTNLSAFNGMSPLGKWYLYVMDDNIGTTGSIDNWILSLQTSPAILPIGTVTTVENNPVLVPVTLASDSLTNLSGLTVSAASKSDEVPTNLVGLLVQNIVSTPNSTNPSLWYLTITPGLNLPSIATNVPPLTKASVDISVTVNGASPFTTSFPLTVLYSNIPPFVTASTNNLVINEDGSGTVTFTFNDVNATILSNGVAVYSRNTALLPNSANNIAIATIPTNGYAPGTTPNSVTVTLTPAPYVFGTNLVDFVVSGGTASTTNTIGLSVIHVYQPPIIGGLSASNYTAAATTTQPITFWAASVEGVPPADITVTATSLTPTLVPNTANNIVLSTTDKTGTNYSLVITPVAAQSGNAFINVVATETTGNKTSRTSTFELVVGAPAANFAGTSPVQLLTNIPSISPYPVQFTMPAPGDSPLVGNVYDVKLELRGFSHTNPGNLDFLLVSPDGTPVMLMSGAGGASPVSNLDLVFDQSGVAMPLAGTLISGTYQASYYTKGAHALPGPAPQPTPTDYNGSLLAFQDKASANGTWSLYINDKTGQDTGAIAGGAFLTVSTRPVISISGPTVVTMGENPGPLSTTSVGYTVSDSTIVPTNLVVTAATAKGNNVLQAGTQDIQISQPAANGTGTITLTPEYLTFGSNLPITLTVTRTNDNVTASANLTVTVVSTNFPPIVYRLLAQSTPATTPIDVQILASDIDTPLSSLSITATPLGAADAQIIPKSGLLFTNSGSNSVTGLTPVSASQPGLGSVWLHITPNQASSGSATIQLTVTDPKTASGYVFTNIVTSNLVVNVTSVPGIPTVTPNFTLPQSVAAGTSKTLMFTVGTPTPAPPPVLVLTNVTSTVPTLVNNNNIVVASAGGNVWNVTLPAQASAKGPTTISVQAYDATHNLFSAPYTFTLTVTPTPQHNYANDTAIDIIDVSPASPYPSTIPVGGLNGMINNVTVTLLGFWHQYPSDVGALLISPAGKKIVLMNRAGAGFAIPTTGINLTFDQNAATPVPQFAPILAGSYQPADYLIASGAYNFYPNAPQHPYGLSLADLVGTAPNGTWSLYMQDSVAVESGYINNGWSLSITTQPVINGLADVTIPESGSTTENFSIADDSPSGPSFTFAMSSPDATLFPQSGLSVAPLPGDKTGTNFVLTIAPGLDHFGTNTVTVQATDIDNLVATRTINVSVPFSPQPPLVSLVPTNYLNMLAGATLQVPVIYSDPQNLPMTLSVVDSSNTNLLPLTSITIVGTNLQIRPFGANSGQAVLTVQVQEQGGTGLSTTTNLTLNVTPVPNLFGAGGYIDMVDFSPANPYPSSIKVSGIVGNILGAKVTLRNFGHTFPHDVSAVLVAPGGQEIILLSRVGNGAMSGAVDLTLDSAATTPLPPSQPLTGGTYAPTSYNPSLVFLQGFPAGPYVTNLTVLSNTAPTGQWSLYVQDDTRQDSGAITNGWTIQFVTSAPTIQPVAGQTVPENGSLGVALQVASNVGNDVTKIVVTPNAPTLENPLGLISEGTLVASKPDTNGLVTLTVTPAQNLPSAAPGWLVNSNGTAQINVTVVDGTNPPTSMSFPLTVTYVNQGPTIVGLENTNTPANAPLTFSFAAADVDTPVASLEVGIQSISDNTDSSISLSGKGATEYITLTPNDFSGAAIITVTNFDPISGLTATQSVTVTVTTPAPPVLAPIDPITALPGAPVQVTLKITPGGTPLSGLAVSYSGLPANDASIAPLTQTTAVITPAAGFIGTFNVTATVSDGVTKVSQTFPVTWAPPVPPTLGAIAAQSVEAGQSKTFALPIQPGGVALSALTVSAASANTGIATASGAANASVILTGVQPGSTSVTVTVNDGYNSPVTQTFQVAVFAPQPPVWGLLTNQIVTGLDTPVTITLPVTSVETPISNLVFAAIIKTNVVSSVVFTNYATNVTATFNVVFNAVGSEAVTLTMFDGYNTESVETEVIVTELPAVQAIGPQTVQENGSLPVSFKVASYVGNDVTQILVMPSVTQENPPGLVSSGKLVASSPDTNGVVTLTIVPGANLPSAYPGSAPFWPLGSNGTAQITLQVNDGGFISTNSFPLTVIYANQAPSIVGLVNTNTTVNTPITIGFMAADVDTPGSMLQVGIQGAVDNTGSGIFLTSKGNTQLLTLIPFGSAGAASITITNFDPLSQLTATQTVTITVTLEAPPTLAAIPDVSTPENTPVTVPLNVTSPVIPISQLSFNYKLSNSNLVASVAFSVNGSTVTAQITPAKNQMGSSAVTIYVSDGVVTVSQPFDFAVTAPVGPTLGPLANVTTRENSPINLQLVVTDPVTPLANLTFGGSSSNPGLVQSVVVNNNGTTATATVNLVANAFGAAVVTISVSDGFTTASQSFSLVVQAAPSVSPIGPQTVAENGTLPPIPFSILNADLATLSVSASAYANGLVTGLTIGGTGSNLTITVTVAPNTSGTSVINIVADDQYGAGSGSFLLTVTPVPTLGPIADQTTPKNTPVNVLLAVTDPVTPLSNLTFTASASNTKLVQSVVVNKNGTTASATINLVTNAYGVSLVTISVNDGFMTVSQSFALLVLPTPPSLGPISDVTAIAGATAVNVPLNVVSPDTALSQLTFVGSSTNTDIVSGVTFSTVGSTVTATVNLVSNKVGKATVKIDVSDGYATSSQSFAVTVGTPARPILSATLVGTVLHITFTGVPNGSYVIQSSPDLKTWTPVGPAITADSNGKVEYDAPVNSSGPQYFRALFQ